MSAQRNMERQEDPLARQLRRQASTPDNRRLLGRLPQFKADPTLTREMQYLMSVLADAERNPRR